MEVKEIENKNIWEDFLLGCEEKTFLQSWNWGEFNKMMGNKIWRLGIVEEDKSSSSPFAAARVYNNGEPRGPLVEQAGGRGGRVVVSVALVVKTVAKRGTFLLVPHGPVFAKATAGKPNIKHETLKVLLEELKKIARDEKVDFIRISPILERSEENEEIFKKLGFKEAPIHAHPEASWKLDITSLEEKLLMEMRKTTRYLIRQAEKNQDIEIYQSNKIEDVDAFNRLNEEVAKTQKFIPFSLEYLRNEFLAFQPDYNPPASQNISLFFGKYQGEIVAAAFVIFWSGIGFYHHAALAPKYHKLSIAYLLLWDAVLEAKKRGCKLFDFWGYVDPQKNPKHPWAGPTLFKMGFGGRVFEYVRTQDFPMGGGWVASKKYWLTYIFEKFRKTKRGL